MAGNLKKKRKISHFTQINNDFLRNDKLSWKAKGLLCYLMSNSEGYDVRKKNLQNFASDGYDSTDSAFKELESAGYIKKVGSGRDKNGVFIGFDYEFDDEPSFISETQEKNEKLDSEQIEPIGVSRRGLPVAAEPSRLTPDKEEQYKEEQVIPTVSSNNKEEKVRSTGTSPGSNQIEIFDKEEFAKPSNKFSENQFVIDFFYSFYKEKTGTDYVSKDGKDFSNLKRIRDAIRDKLEKDFGVINPTPEQVADTSCKFISASYTCDKWLMNNFTPSNIYSQFNQSYLKIKNGINANSNYQNNRSVGTGFKFGAPDPRKQPA